jgi:hypothetical protein
VYYHQSARSKVAQVDEGGLLRTLAARKLVQKKVQGLDAAKRRVFMYYFSIISIHVVTNDQFRAYS